VFEEITRSVAGLAFGLIDIGLLLTIIKRWQNGSEKSTKSHTYMALHYGRFLSWILLGFVLGGLWHYIAGRVIALGLIPIIWLQAKNPRPPIVRMLLVSTASIVFAHVIGLFFYFLREEFVAYISYFEIAVILFFIPQVLIGNPAQMRRYLRGPINGESRYLHVFVAVNSAAWALYGVAASIHWIWICYGAIMIEEIVLIAIISHKKKREKRNE
jgi:hypothetical protein